MNTMKEGANDRVTTVHVALLTCLPVHFTKCRLSGQMSSKYAQVEHDCPQNYFSFTYSWRAAYHNKRNTQHGHSIETFTRSSRIFFLFWVLPFSHMLTVTPAVLPLRAMALGVSSFGSYMTEIIFACQTVMLVNLHWAAKTCPAWQYRPHGWCSPDVSNDHTLTDLRSIWDNQ